MSLIKEQCSSMTKANTNVGNLLESFNSGEIIEDEIILQLLHYHPTKKINIDNVEWLKMKPRPPFDKPALFYKYKNSKNEDDIAWKLCIRNLYGKYDPIKEYIKNVKSAFRNESHIGTKKQYFIDHTTPHYKKSVGICKKCNTKTTRITTDHYPAPYKKIFDDFIKNKNIKLCDIGVFENENNEIRIKDRELASEWLFHHDNNSKYRLLCGSCNSSGGSYGYK